MQRLLGAVEEDRLEVAAAPLRRPREELAGLGVRRRRSRGPCRPTRRAGPGRETPAAALMRARSSRQRRRRSRRSDRASSQRSKRSREAARARRSARPGASPGRPSIGGCSGSSSQGWSVKTAGLAAVAGARLGLGEPRARRASGTATRRRAGAAGRRPRPVSGGSSTSDQPSRLDPVRARADCRRGRAAAPASSRRRSGSPPRRASASAGASGVADRPLRGAVDRDGRAAAGALDAIARPAAGRRGTPPASARRRGGAGRRARRSRVPAARPRARGPDAARAIQPRKKTVARWPPRVEPVEERRRASSRCASAKRVPAPRIRVVAVAADVEPVLRVDRQDARRAPAGAQRRDEGRGHGGDCSCRARAQLIGFSPATVALRLNAVERSSGLVSRVSNTL